MGMKRPAVGRSRTGTQRSDRQVQRDRIRESPRTCPAKGLGGAARFGTWGHHPETEFPSAVSQGSVGAAHQGFGPLIESRVVDVGLTERQRDR